MKFFRGIGTQDSGIGKAIVTETSKKFIKPIKFRMQTCNNLDRKRLFCYAKV